jgi:hypothetical protein
MSTHPLAGKPAPKDLLIDVSRLEAALYGAKPDPTDPNQLKPSPQPNSLANQSRRSLLVRLATTPRSAD